MKRESWMKNRDVVREPKQGNNYCMACDRALVPDGAKCHVCGNRNGLRTNKKTATVIDYGMDDALATSAERLK